jgi:dipeptide/tripeptide permease
MIEQIKSLRILHIGFVMSQLIFAAVVFYLINGSLMQPVLTELGNNEKIKTILFGLATVLIVGGNGLFTRSVKAINDGTLSVQEKLERYKKAAIIRYAMIEASSLLFIIFALLTADAKNLVYAGVLILILIFTRPTLAVIAKNLKVSENELT